MEELQKGGATKNMSTPPRKLVVASASWVVKGAVDCAVLASPLTEDEQEKFRSFNLGRTSNDGSLDDRSMPERLQEFFRLAAKLQRLKWRHVLEQFILFPLSSSVAFRNELLNTPQWPRFLTPFMGEAAFATPTPEEDLTRLKEERSSLLRVMLTIVAKLLEYTFQTREGLYFSLEELFALLAREVGWTKATCDFSRLLLTTLINMMLLQVDLFKHNFSHVSWGNLFDYCAVLEDFIFYRPALIRAGAVEKRSSGMHLDSKGCVDAMAVERLLLLLEKLKVHDLQADVYEVGLAKRAMILRERTLREKNYWQRIHVLFQTIRLMDTAEMARTPIKAITSAWRELRRPSKCRVIPKKVLKDSLYAMVEFMHIHKQSSARTKLGANMDISMTNITILSGFEGPGFADETGPRALMNAGKDMVSVVASPSPGYGTVGLGGNAFRASMARRQKRAQEPAGATLASPRGGKPRHSRNSSKSVTLKTDPSLAPSGDYSSMQSPTNESLKAQGETEGNAFFPSSPSRPVTLSIDSDSESNKTVEPSPRELLSPRGLVGVLRNSFSSSKAHPPSNHSPPAGPKRVSSLPPRNGKSRSHGRSNSSGTDGRGSYHYSDSEDLEKVAFAELLASGGTDYDKAAFGELLASGGTNRTLPTSPERITPRFEVPPTPFAHGIADRALKFSFSVSDTERVRDDSLLAEMSMCSMDGDASSVLPERMTSVDGDDDTSDSGDDHADDTHYRHRRSTDNEDRPAAIYFIDESKEREQEENKKGRVESVKKDEQREESYDTPPSRNGVLASLSKLVLENDCGDIQVLVDTGVISQQPD
eukprot:gb/GEZN01001351.1/.p1 GENE.gb/GEZN01001351.1/~~gb/GEZN01001351.1/.p1  ORF type:complete len:819 (+),score=121.30 gb/GEZN01001351.1/:51-2507(+)